MRRSQSFRLRKGVIYHLDFVYDVLALIPHHCYEQGDTFTGEFVESDIGDEIRMLKNVDLDYQVKTS